MTTEPEPTTGNASSDDAGDDYGYDLAHEVGDALKIPVARRRSATPTRRSSGTGATDQDGDLGYDDAHEIRGS